MKYKQITYRLYGNKGTARNRKRERRTGPGEENAEQGEERSGRWCYIEIRAKP